MDVGGNYQHCMIIIGALVALIGIVVAVTGAAIGEIIMKNLTDPKSKKQHLPLQVKGHL